MNENEKHNGDPIAQAIAATEAPAAIQMQQHTLTINSTGRPFQMVFPVDMTDSELLEVIGWMGSDLRLYLQARRKNPLGRLVAPGGGPIA